MFNFLATTHNAKAENMVKLGIFHPLRATECTSSDEIWRLNVHHGCTLACQI